jgi:hypothetical protein
MADDVVAEPPHPQSPAHAQPDTPDSTASPVGTYKSTVNADARTIEYLEIQFSSEQGKPDSSIRFGGTTQISVPHNL